MNASMTEIGECNQQGQLTLKKIQEELDASLQLILSDIMESIQGNSRTNCISDWRAGRSDGASEWLNHQTKHHL